MKLKSAWTVFGILAGAMIFTMACGAVTNLLSGGKSAGTVNQLWDDVPAFDGAQKADLDMPLAARLMVQTMLQGKMNFVAYTTEQAPETVEAYYTTERMQGSGWNGAGNAVGCTGDSSTESVGAVCIFMKEGGEKEEALAVVIARDEGSSETQIFYVRIDLTEENQSE